MPHTALLLLPLVLAAPVAAADEWSLARDHQGVRIYRRPVGFSKVDAVRAEIEVALPAERLFRLLGDIEAYPELMPPTVVARRIKDEGERRSYYMEIDPPVVARRYYCMQVRMSRRGDGVLRSEWSAFTDGCPAPPRRMVRMSDNAGAWTLVPLGAARTRVIYEAHADPGGAIPAWMVNRAATTQLVDLLQTLAKAAALPRYEAPAR